MEATAATEWDTLLDAFERELRDPSHLPVPFDPPTTPLPERLRARAVGIIARQEERQQQILEAMAQTRRHLDALDLVPDRHGTSTPVYLDCDA